MERNVCVQFTVILATVLSLSLSGQSNTPPEDFTIQKGRYYSSLTFSLNQRKAENENQILRQVIDQRRLNYRLTGNAGYAVRDNLTLGLLLGYGTVREEINYLDENANPINSKRLERGVAIAPTMRNYIPIGSGQLQILIQSQIGITTGESLQRVYFEDDVDKIEGSFIDFEVGVSPGVVLFFDRHWAFETTVGIAGFQSRYVEEIRNNDTANRKTVTESSVDLRINLLQLNLGVAHYF